MKLIFWCEFSGAMRRAARARGHDAWSCDLLPAEDGSPFHIQDDILSHLEDGWDGGGFHPPCTRTAVSGARWFKLYRKEQDEAIEFIRKLMAAPFPHYLEQPISVVSTRIRKPDQIIQPWQFGHGETKATCLWLKDLPLLKPTNIVSGRHARVHLASPGPDRWKERSRTLPGIAEAMADQWWSAARVA